MSSILLFATLTACDGDTGLGRPEPDPPPETSFLTFTGPAPRNLLYISIDTLRKDHLDRYGGMGLAPFMDSLMREGVPLDAHQSCSNWTYAGVLCALSGQNGVDFGFIPRLSKTYREDLPDDTPMLPDWLREIGFGSGLVTSNGYLSSKYNTAQGFDMETYPGYEPAETMMGLALDDIGQLQANYERWFLHLHLRDVHIPYTPPDEYLTGLDDLPPIDWNLANRDEMYEMAGMYWTLSEEERAAVEQHARARYEATIRYTDDSMRDFFDELDRRGVLDDTLVVFWSDHGEQFWEHQRQSHAWSLHYGENDALAFFWARDLEHAPWTGATTHEDIVPTLYEVFGMPQREEFTGLPVGVAAGDRVLYFTADGRKGPEQAVQVAGHKLMYMWSGSKEFYRRDVDPREENDLYDPEDEEVIALWALLDEYIERSIPLLEGKDPIERGP